MDWISFASEISNWTKHCQSLGYNNAIADQFDTGYYVSSIYYKNIQLKALNFYVLVARC